MAIGHVEVGKVKGASNRAGAARQGARELGRGRSRAALFIRDR